MSENRSGQAESFTRRAFLVSTTAALVGLGLGSAAVSRQSSANAYEFAGGRWFDGHKFKSQSFYTAGGFLTAKKPARVERVFDLTGKYVVPPFGEAHNHNVEWSSAEQFARVKRMYLEGGIFYVKNPNSLPRATTPLLGKINIPTSIDVTFAGGGLTASGGHPIEIVRRNIERGGMTAADGEGAFYFVIDTAADLERKWKTIEAGKPDFIKTYLLYSEEYARRKDDKAFYDWRGLDPALLPEIVRRAHLAGLRVSTHIETATDFHYALAAGVDEINHTPGFRPEGNDVANYKDLSRYQISEQDAQLAARHRVVVVTTMGSAIRWTFDEKDKSPETRTAVRAMLAGNLQILKKHNVSIAIGSDSYRETSVPEALNLHRLNVFDNLTLLKMWCETTVATIFPKRRIGHLKPGYEASFLVLGGDPIADFANVQKIETRVKQGELITL